MGVRDGDFRLNLPCRLDYLGCESVNGPSAGIVAFKSVAIGDARQFADTDPAAALPRQPIFFVFAIHEFVREVALQEIEVQTVHGDQLRQQHCFERVFTGETVAEHEAPALTRMGM